MKGIAIIFTGMALFLVSCDQKPERMTVDETRKLTTKDKDPKLFATSDERFRDSKPSPVEAVAPESWLALPPAQFRDLNYRFGESGISEVYVSILSGGVLENVNRWLKQFGKDPLSDAEFAEMERVAIGGGRGVWVTAEGEYGAGMMGSDETKPGYGLAGVIADLDGKLVTIKMLGPEAEVNAEKENLKLFAASLKLVE